VLSLEQVLTSVCIYVFLGGYRSKCVTPPLLPSLPPSLPPFFLTQLYKASPSKRDGMSDAEERRLRHEGAAMIERLARRLDM